MADNNFVVQKVKFYEFGKNSLSLSIVHNKQWNSFSVNITRKFTYTQDGETKEGSSSTYLNLTAAKALVNQLPLAYQSAKNLQNNQGLGIYNIFCLISKICYTFSHRSAASDRERLDRWSARRHCRSRRQRSLEYRKLCAGRRRTHSRWSRSARIWESRRRNWTHVCLILLPSYKRTSCKRRSRDNAKPPPTDKKRESNQQRRPSNRSSDDLTRQGCQMDGIKSCSRPRYRNKAQARVQV